MSPVLKILVGVWCAWYAVYPLTWQTGRDIPPLQEDERMAKIFLGEGNFKVSTTWHSTSTVWCGVKNNRLVDNWSVVRWFFLRTCLIGTYLLKSQIRVGYQWPRRPSSEFQRVNWFSVCSHRLQKSSPHSEVFDHTSAGEYVYSSVGDNTIQESTLRISPVFFFLSLPRLWGSLRCVQSVML